MPITIKIPVLSMDHKVKKGDVYLLKLLILFPGVTFQPCCPVILVSIFIISGNNGP